MFIRLTFHAPKAALQAQITRWRELSRNSLVDSYLCELSPFVLPNGEEMSFGKLKLAQHGLSFQGSTLAWDEVDYISIEGRDNGNVCFSALVVWHIKDGRRKEWWTKGIPHFPNYRAFLQLASQFARIESGQS